MAASAKMAAASLPSFARRDRIEDPVLHNHCPSITVTGAALAITGPWESAEFTSMRIT